MPVSNTDKQRAKRLRKRATLTAQERAWLDAYDASVSRPAFMPVRPTPPAAPAHAHAPAPAPAHAPALAPAGPAPIALDLTKGFVSVDTTPQTTPAPTPPPAVSSPPGVTAAGSGVGLPPTPAGVAPSVSPGATLAPIEAPPAQAQCQIPHCPCKSKLGGQICITTGKTVWPPMDGLAAEIMAGGLLRGMAWLGSLVREDKRTISPLNDDIKALGRAIQMIQVRRANWVGAIDDIILFVGVIIGFGMKVLAEPEKLPEQAA